MRVINKDLTILELSAKTADFDTKAGNGVAVRDFRELSIMVDVQAITGSMSVQPIVKHPHTDNWCNLGTPVAITATGVYKIDLTNFGSNIAVDVSLTGTSSLAIGAVGKV